MSLLNSSHSILVLVETFGQFKIRSGSLLHQKHGEMKREGARTVSSENELEFVGKSERDRVRVCLDV